MKRLTMKRLAMQRLAMQRLATGVSLALILVCMTAVGAAFGATDVITVGVASDIRTLDPSISMDNFDRRQIYPCYDRLVAYKPGCTEVTPSAAESWSASEDGRVWTFRLRKGIAFTDGSPLDAKAVKFSLERTLQLGKGPADTLSAIKSVKVVDAYTVQITLHAPFGPFIQTLATSAASIINPAVMEHEQDGDLAQGWLTRHTAGSGPYRMAEWTPGQRAVLESRPDYWGGAPKTAKAVIRFLPDVNERRMALARGEVDIAENIPPYYASGLGLEPGVVVREYPSQLVEYVYLNTQKPALADRRVRQALSYATDYEGVIKLVLEGDGVQMRGPVPQGMWGYDAEAHQYSRDVDKARKLLAAAGSENLQLTLIYSERRPGWSQIARLLEMNFADAGVDLKLEELLNPQLRDRVDKGDFELCLGVWSPDYADPSMFMNFWFDSNNWGLPGNRAFYKNGEVDELLRQALRLSDPGERAKLYSRVQEIVVQDAPYIFLHQVNAVIPMRENVKGYTYNPMLESMYIFQDMWKE